MKYSLASAAALLQLAAAQHFTNSSTPATTITKKPHGTSVGTTSFWTSTKPTGVTTITEVVDTVVTYCPAPTVLSLGPNKVYTVTEPGTVTIKDCPCTLSKAVSTEVVTAYTTYCPAPTTITQGTQKYTITAPGVATITNCPCTLTHPIAAPAPTSPAQAPPAAPAPPAGSACPACPSCPAAQTVTVTVGPNGVPVAPSGPAPSGPAPSGPAPGTTVVPPPVGPSTVVPPPVGPSTVVPPPVGPTTVVSPPVGPTTVVPPPVGPSTVVPPPPKNTTVPTGKTCPLTLAGAEYQYPHLIVEAAAPNGVFSATSYNATISAVESAYLNFDIPASYAGKTCDIIFALPTQAQLETSSFTLSGHGPLNFGRLSKPAVTGQMSSNTTTTALGSWTPVPGNAFKVASNACKAGSTVGYKISSPSVNLEYFQDYNPCPIGLYVVAH